MLRLADEGEVLGYEVPVAHIDGVHVVDRPHDLLREDGGQVDVALVLEGLVQLMTFGWSISFMTGDAEQRVPVDPVS